MYLHRTGEDTESKKINSIISLVSRAEQTNFEFIKKCAGVEFTAGKLASTEDIEKAKIAQIAKQAVQTNHLENENIKTTTEAIIAHDDKEAIIAYLLHNTLVELPEALRKAESNRSRGGRNNDDRDSGRRDNRDNNRGGRNQRNNRSRDRDDNRGRNNNRNQRDNRDNRDNKRGERGGRRDYDRDLPPAPKDVRVYIGHGSKHGFSQDELTKIVTDNSELTGDQIKRFSIRKNYAYVDFPEEIADTAIGKLNESSREDGSEFFCKRATTISGPRPAAPKEEKEASETGAPAVEAAQVATETAPAATPEQEAV